MTFCQNCGKELQDEWQTCPFCSVVAEAENKSENITQDNTEYTALQKLIGIQPVVDYVKNPENKKTVIAVIIAIIILVVVANQFRPENEVEDNGITVRYTAININCESIEVQYVDPDEEVNFLTLSEGESWEEEIPGFEYEDLIGVSGTNKDDGYCHIIVRLYSDPYVSMENRETVDSEDTVSLATLLIYH